MNLRTYEFPSDSEKSSDRIWRWKERKETWPLVVVVVVVVVVDFGAFGRRRGGDWWCTVEMTRESNRRDYPPVVLSNLNSIEKKWK